jgi:hypothetical protein
VAGRFDVAARLAEGRPAAEHTQSYVWACHALGYQHPELTAHGTQVRDWYGSEHGLDLHALDGDCAELWAAVTAIEEALRIQRAQFAELAVAWTGSGADSAVQFLQRHCEAGNAVATGVRAAAEGCAALRDNLWQLIDSKVAAATAIDDRTLAQRPAWLAAAQAVTTGAGDRPTADEMVQQQVKPYVDNDIRTEWLTAMRATLASAAASYDALTDRLSTAPVAIFEPSSDLGSSCSMPSAEPVQPSAPTLAAPVTPAAAVAPPDGATAMSPPGDAPAVSPLADAPPTIPGDIFSTVPLDPVATTTPTPPAFPISGLEDLPAMPPISDLGAPLGEATGMPTGVGIPGDLGGPGGLSSLGSLVGRIADAIGGLVGSLTEGLADPSGIDDAPLDSDDLLDDDDAPDRPDEGVPPACGGDANDQPDEVEADDEQADSGGENAASGSVADSPPGNVADAPTAQGVTTPPADGPPLATPPTGEPSPPAAAPPPGEPSPPVGSDPQPDGSTPCEIAADELPQAGQ